MLSIVVVSAKVLIALTDEVADQFSREPIFLRKLIKWGDIAFTHNDAESGCTSCCRRESRRASPGIWLRFPFRMDTVFKVAQCAWSGAFQMTVDHKSGFHHVPLAKES